MRGEITQIPLFPKILQKSRYRKFFYINNDEGKTEQAVSCTCLPRLRRLGPQLLSQPSAPPATKRNSRATPTTPPAFDEEQHRVSVKQKSKPKKNCTKTI